MVDPVCSKCLAVHMTVAAVETAAAAVAAVLVPAPAMAEHNKSARNGLHNRTERRVRMAHMPPIHSIHTAPPVASIAVVPARCIDIPVDFLIRWDRRSQDFERALLAVLHRCFDICEDRCRWAHDDGLAEALMVAHGDRPRTAQADRSMGTLADRPRVAQADKSTAALADRSMVVLEADRSMDAHKCADNGRMELESQLAHIRTYDNVAVFYA